MGNFDPNFGDGVTRNPFHPSAESIFATNFDDLRFFVGDEEYAAEDVIGAHPDVDTLLIMNKDESEEHGYEMDQGRAWPKMIGINGDVKIVGTAKSCNCAMSKFMKSNWWAVTMSYGKAVKPD